MKNLPTILMAFAIGLPLIGRGEMIAPPTAEVRAGLEAVRVSAETDPANIAPSAIDSEVLRLSVSAEPVSSEAQAWKVTVAAYSHSLSPWQVSVLALLNAESPWVPSLAGVDFLGLGLVVAIEGHKLSEVMGEMLKMRAAVSGKEPFANAGPVGILMQQYEQDPTPERLQRVQTLIEKVNARTGRATQ